MPGQENNEFPGKMIDRNCGILGVRMSPVWYPDPLMKFQ